LETISSFNQSLYLTACCLRTKCYQNYSRVFYCLEEKEKTRKNW